VPARNPRLYRDAIAGTELPHILSDFDHLAGAFVTED
jgi:hypothetical protein